MKKAKAYLSHALNSFERLDEKLLSGIALMNLGVVQRVLGNFDRALSQFQRARSHFEEVGDLVRLAEVHYKMGMSFLGKDLPQDGLREFEQCRVLSAGSSNVTLRGLAFLGKANAYFHLEDMRTSLSFADQALEYFSIHDDPSYVAAVYHLKGAIHREMEKVELADWYLYTSLKINLDMKDWLSAGSCYFELGKLHILRRKPGEAMRAFEKSIECYNKIGAAHELKRVSNELNVMRGKEKNELRRSRQAKI